MRRLAALLAVSATLLALGGTAVRAQDFSPFKAARIAGVVIPHDWDGIWSVLDSTYECATDALQGTVAGQDTLCGGRDVSTYPQYQNFQNFVCNGTATSTILDITCTGTIEVVPGCTQDFTTVSHATRDGDTYHQVATVNFTYSGPAPACSYLHATCGQVDGWGTRTGPAPADYCATTPARTATWGQVRIHYR